MPLSAASTVLLWLPPTAKSWLPGNLPELLIIFLVVITSVWQFRTNILCVFCALLKRPVHDSARDIARPTIFVEVDGDMWTEQGSGAIRRRQIDTDRSRLFPGAMLLQFRTENGDASYRWVFRGECDE